MDFFNWLSNFWNTILQGHLGEISPIEFALFVALCVGAFFVLKWLLRFIWEALKVIGRAIVNVLSAKKRCSHVQCRHCGRTLDKCVCQVNKKRGYTSRLYYHHKEMRDLHKREKEHINK